MSRTAILAPLAFALTPAAAAAPQAEDPPPSAYDEDADAAAGIAAALERAGRHHKRVLVQWGANWCGLCRSLHALSEEEGPLRRVLQDAYEVVRVDVGHYDRNLDLAGRYGAALFERGIPYLTVLDGDGSVVAHGARADFIAGAGMDAVVQDDGVTAFLEDYRPAPRDAEAILAAARKRAAEERKRVWLTFGAPW